MSKKRITVITILTTLILSSAVAFAVALNANTEDNIVLRDLISTQDRNMDISSVPYEIMTDIDANSQSYMDIAGEVLIIHCHSWDEGMFLLNTFKIPQYVYDEMGELGWNIKTQRECVSSLNSHQIDVTKGWEFILGGKTQDEVISLKLQNDNKKTLLLNQYINDEISLETYISEYPFELERKTTEQSRKPNSST